MYVVSSLVVDGEDSVSHPETRSEGVSHDEVSGWDDSGFCQMGFSGSMPVGRGFAPTSPSPMMAGHSGRSRTTSSETAPNPTVPQTTEHGRLRARFTPGMIGSQRRRPCMMRTSGTATTHDDGGLRKQRPTTTPTTTAPALCSQGKPWSLPS